MKSLRFLLCFTVCLFLCPLSPVSSPAAERADTKAMGAEPAYTISFPKKTSGGGDFVSQADTTATFTAMVTNANTKKPVSGVTVTWSLHSSDATANLAVAQTHRHTFNGLTLGDSLRIMSDKPLTISPSATTVTGETGEARQTLRDIVGERTIVVKATATINGVEYTAKQPVKFGKGPLSKLKIPAQGLIKQRWFDAYHACNGKAYEYWALPRIVREPQDKKEPGHRWVNDGEYIGGSKMPSLKELLAVSEVEGNGAGLAAGWPGADWYWTGNTSGSTYGGQLIYIILSTGYQGVLDEDNNSYAICRR